MYQFNYFAIPPLFTAIYLFILGLFVFTKNKKSMTNITFGLLCLSSAIWQFGFSMEYLSKTKELALFWNRSVYLGVNFITPTLYHFSVSFLNLKKQKKFVYLAYIFAIIFVFLSRTEYFISGLREYSWGYYTKVNMLHHPFLVIWFVIGTSALINLYKGYRRINAPFERQRTKYAFLALLISFIGALDYMAAYGINLYPFGYLFVIVCLSIIAYSILKYRLMDIRVAITRTGIFIAVYTLVLGLPYLLVVFGKVWLIQFWGANWWWGPLILLTMLATAGPFIYIYFQRRAETILLREQIGYQETLKQAARELARIRNLKRLLTLIVHTVTKVARISHSAIYLFNEDSEQFFLKATRHLKKELPNSVNKNNSLIFWLENQKESLVYEEVNRKAQDNPDSIFKELKQQMELLNAMVIVPGFLKDRLLGFLILGNKRSGEFYTSQDLSTFMVLGNQAALAIENASLYENIEEQVRQRTKELMGVQKQLIQAEKMATVGTLAGGVAHEINNPLTAILTNVQMLLAENPVDSKLDRESLELIEEATKRCRTIIQKLMTYAKKPLEAAELSRVNLLGVINKVISFLGYQLEQENIKIITRAKENTYLVIGNHNELEQVVTNIVLNAKDTIRQVKKSGNIDISLSENGNWIQMKIKDDGQGIPKEIMSKIFDPFFTTKEVGKGLGLGLSICHSIVEKHGGLINVLSESGKGSVFTIQLPKIKDKGALKTGILKE